MPTIPCHFSDVSLHFGHRTLFSSLAASLKPGCTGLVAPNGQGKSALLSVLAGALTPASGVVTWAVPFVHVRPVAQSCEGRIADLLGIASEYDAFARIETGVASADDFDAVSSLWHLPGWWREQCREAGIVASLDTSLAGFSSGQLTRILLCGAFLRRDHFLLLDEPSNHLDAEGRAWLVRRLQAHSGGSLVASHDRQLLESVDRILELSSFGLEEFGGNYQIYRQCRDAETEALVHRAQALDRQLASQHKEQQAALQRAARRRKQGLKVRESGSMGKLLLDRRKDQSEQSLSRIKHQQQHQQMQTREQLKETRDRLEQREQQKLFIDGASARGGALVTLTDVILPFGLSNPFSFTVHRGERWHIAGGNGSGKSTLLKVIAGDYQVPAGELLRSGSHLYLDQHFSLLDKMLTAADFLRQWNPSISEADWRTRLAGMRLKADKALLPIGNLSSGEQMKVALLAISGAEIAPDMLLLDEPENFLDLDSRILLETTLAQWRGALMVVSHDAAFVESLGLEQQWRLRPIGINESGCPD